MKALVYRAPHQVDFCGMPDPAPGPGEALVAVRAVGICGSDMHAFHGQDARRPPPLILGHEAAGIVVAGEGLGRRVTINPLVVEDAEGDFVRAGKPHLSPKRQILSMPPRPGAFAELVRVPVGNLYDIPPDFPFEKAALAEPLAVSYHAVMHGLRLLELGAQKWAPVLRNTKRQNKDLELGAQKWTPVLRNTKRQNKDLQLGAQKWTPVLRNTKRKNKDLQLGAQKWAPVFPNTKQPHDDLGREREPLRAAILGGGAIGLGAGLVLAMLGVEHIALGEPNAQRRAQLAKAGPFSLYAPGGTEEPAENSIDLIIDAVGAPASRAASCRLIRPGGVIVHAGLLPGHEGLDIRKITLQEIVFTGTYCYTPDDFAAVVGAMVAGKLGPLDWFETRPLAEGAAAFAAIDAGEVAASKIVLLP